MDLEFEHVFYCFVLFFHILVLFCFIFHLMSKKCKLEENLLEYYVTL